jgi:hypothetical protein
MPRIPEKYPPGVSATAEKKDARKLVSLTNQPMRRGCVRKLIFDLCVAVVEIAELISCAASSLPWQFV